MTSPTLRLRSISPQGNAWIAGSSPAITQRLAVCRWRATAPHLLRSFPRTREPRPEERCPRVCRGKGRNCPLDPPRGKERGWVPAFAGMSGCGVAAPASPHSTPRAPENTYPRSRRPPLSFSDPCPLGGALRRRRLRGAGCGARRSRLATGSPGGSKPVSRHYDRSPKAPKARLQAGTGQPGWSKGEILR